MPRKKKSQHTGAKIAAVGAVALGTYLLYGSENAKRNRKKAKSWMLKAKAEALEAVEKAKSLDRESYQKIIDNIEAKYKKLKHVDNKDLARLAIELKSHYDDAAKKVKKTAKKATKKAKKTARKKTTT